MKDEWINPNPAEGGQYIPEGTEVIMYNRNTKRMWIDFRYSSLPKPYQLADGWVTDWMPMPEGYVMGPDMDHSMEIPN